MGPTCLGEVGENENIFAWIALLANWCVCVWLNLFELDCCIVFGSASLLCAFCQGPTCEVRQVFF